MGLHRLFQAGSAAAAVLCLFLPFCETFRPVQVARLAHGARVLGACPAAPRQRRGCSAREEGSCLARQLGGIGGAPCLRPCLRRRRRGGLALGAGEGQGGRPEWEVLMGALESKAFSQGALLRPAEEGELDRVLQLSERFREEMNPDSFRSMIQSGGMEWMRSEIAEVLQVNDLRPPHLLVLCEEGSAGAVRGYIYSTVEEWFGAESLYIAELFVEEGHRGRGLGGLLTAASLHLATVHGITRSHLCVGTRQQVAGRMYTQSFGFAALEGTEGLMTDLELKDVKIGVKKYCDKILRDLV